MNKTLQAIRGMNDILPTETPVWQHIESLIRTSCQQYGYSEIRFPIVESTPLFKRTIGEVTDIVEKEMYTFDDRNGDSLTLRPEGTAGCVRAGIQNGLLYNQIQRLWYMGPFYRHERPQKGRYRQFHQLGAECFGLAGADTDAEMILLSKRLIDKLGLSDDVTLEINTLGSADSRKAHRVALMEYLNENKDALDEDSLRRLNSNPLRILDSKNPSMQDLITKAPELIEYLDDASKQHFADLRHFLDELGISYVVNPRLVRGLDYYCHTVFEWTTTSLGAQGTVCAGGRYDGLVEQLGGKSTPAVGFAMGLERIALMLENLEKENPLQAYIIPLGDKAFTKAMQLGEKLREHGVNVVVGNNTSMKNQMKRADNSDAELAIILGDDEIENGTVTLKHLREKAPQENIPLEELFAKF